MKKLRPDLLNLLGTEFAGDNPKRGFSFDEIIDFFREYDCSVSKEGYEKIRPTRKDLFESCLTSLPPVQQIVVVLDLLNDLPASKYPMPTQGKITKIKKYIFSILNLAPVSDNLASLSFRNLIKDWYRIISRIRESPAGSITASRTMIENLYVWVLKERGMSQNEVDKIKGDLGKLHKAVCKVLDIDEWAKKIISGLTSMVYGIAETSNIAGDRHAGNYESITFEMAEFVAYIAGSISIFIYKLFLLKNSTYPNI